ncbi:hypothetical protein BDV36DRAFT_262415 [Aspergillus pseudocaelatus]|uniref:Uncharacterized protein n=1 Tax=Aspergillus pseudocaelatus TaxID=1825620 RepID=A0ABQ6WF00_9EURO|nr:hypothetical protein BDV36DRAFT_262415 [Aspergillus pseudocaelatus]
MVDRNDDLTGISYPEQHVNLSRLDRRRITPWHMEQSCLGSSSTGSLVESHASTSTFQSTLSSIRSPERNDSKRTKLGHFRSAMAHRIHPVTCASTPIWWRMPQLTRLKDRWDFFFFFFSFLFFSFFFPFLRPSFFLFCLSVDPKLLTTAL